jgi:hypothetical protein
VLPNIKVVPTTKVMAEVVITSSFT